MRSKSAPPSKAGRSGPSAARRTSSEKGKRSESVSRRQEVPTRKSRTPQPLPPPVVGIGASAGGLEAVTELLKNLPGDTGLAFVLVTHLGDTSVWGQVLGRTSGMPVRQAGRRTPIEPNHIYVIPPRKLLTIQDGALLSQPVTDKRHLPAAIDHFLLSLAEDRGDRAIGVILSGTGSDGTVGLAAVRASGGLTFVQHPKSAIFPDMPAHAASSDRDSDFILPPAEIARQLARLGRHTLRRRAAELDIEREAEGQLEQLLGLVRTATGLDLRGYKPTTVHRRIARRMVLHHLSRLSDYVNHVRSHPEEIDALYQDLLIHVTRFFRDRKTFEFLSRRIVREILAKRDSTTPIRVWVPGCATGEEAYSIAIILLEALGESGPHAFMSGGLTGRPVRIFATDVSEAAIRKAREGLYPAGIATDVSRARLKRFFIRVNDLYQVSQSVRDLCVFAVQDLSRDPPFPRMDLISCRNLLIYLGPDLQQRALATFHYALKSGGFLLLGSSETIGASSEMFEQVDRQHRVFLKLDRPGMTAAVELESRKAPKPQAASQFQATSVDDFGPGIDRLPADPWGPPGVLIDSQSNILQFRGDTRLFLEPPPGPATLNLFRMARKSLVGDLRVAVDEAKAQGIPVRREGLRVLSNGRERTIAFEVVPVGRPKSKGRARSYLVVFKMVDAPTDEPGEPEPEEPRRPSHRRRRRSGLQQEFASNPSDLGALIQGLEHTNEYPQSANEEIPSADKELRSMNEELQSARQELQATNNELATLNEELNRRNSELFETNSDLMNVLDSLDGILLVIGPNLSIRRYTPQAERVMNLIPTDIGRPLADIQPGVNAGNLTRSVREVMRTMRPREREVQDRQGRRYSMRIRPYRTVHNRVDGAIVMLVEIDNSRASSGVVRSAGASRSSKKKKQPPR